MNVVMGGVDLTPSEAHGSFCVVIRLGGCDLNCPYCNAHCTDPSACKSVSVSHVLDELLHYKAMTGSIVITGGEPTAQPKALFSLADLCASQGFSVRVHTHGGNPDVLSCLMDDHVVDGLVVDVKAPLSDVDAYNALTLARDADSLVAGVHDSLRLARRHRVPVEVVVPVIPGLNNDPSQFIPLARDVEFADLVVFRAFEKSGVRDPVFRHVSPPSREELLAFACSVKPFLNEVRIHTPDYGEEAV